MDYFLADAKYPVWVKWTDRGGPLGVFNDPKIARKGSPLGMEWEYVRGRISFWRGTCGGREKGCIFHDQAIHSTWYVQRFEIRL